MKAVFSAIALVVCVSSAADAMFVPWTEDPALQASVASASPVKVPSYTVNLDLDPKDRWTEIASSPKLRAAVPAIVDYLDSNIPSWAKPLIEKIGADIVNYFGPEYGEEMKGVAAAYGAPLKLGDVVALNLVMQIESIALNCSTWNVTGPTIPNDPGCMDVDPDQHWCYCKKHPKAVINKRQYLDALGLDAGQNGPSLCTSIVAQSPQGKIFHGRNLDWNVPDALRKVMSDVEFQRSGKTVYRATIPIGFVGSINGVKPGAFSLSLNARGKGGKILTNLIESLLHKASTPAQHLRSVLENPAATDFESAISLISTGDLIDEGYFTVGGVRAGEGAVVARDRNKVHSVWRMNATDAGKWYILETNYDHENPVPVADDRRTPGRANMENMTSAGLGSDGMGLFSVLSTWPTFNHHTDYTGVMSAGEGVYNSFVWED